MRENALPDEVFQPRRDISTQSSKWFPFLTDINAHAGAKLFNLRGVHHPRMIVLMPGQRQAVAFNGVGDKQSRSFIIGAVERIH